jgi:hypothetical protein
MGFRLNQRGWMLLHVTVALLVPVLLLLVVGCKQAHEEKGDLGPAVDPKTIQKVVDDIQDKISVKNLKVGQKLHYEENRRVVGQETTMLMGTHDVTVSHRDDRKDLGATLVTLDHDVTTRQTNGFGDLKSEDTVAIPMDGKVDPPKLLGKNEVTEMVVASGPPPPVVTWHNMKVSTGVAQPASDGSTPPHCGGVRTCDLNVTYLSYDEVHWNNGSPYEQLHFDFAFTADLPYMDGLMGLMLTGCVAQHVQIGEFRYLVRDCNYLTDFDK